MLVLGVGNTAKGRPRVDAHPRRGRLGRGHPRIRQRHQGAGQTELGESIQSVSLFGIHEIERLEFHLSRDLAREGGRIEPADPAHRRLASPHPIPEAIGAVTDGGDRANAGNSDSATLFRH